MSKLNVGILLGSYREGCAGLRVAKYLQNVLEARGATTHVVNADALGLPILTKTYAEYAKAGEVPAVLQGLYDLYQTLDAFVLVTGEYNHTPQPGLLNLLHFFYQEYWFKISGIVSYSIGVHGGLRAVSTLRSLTGALGMPAVRTVVAVGDVRNTLTASGKDTTGTLQKTTDTFCTELLWHAEALQDARAKGIPNLR